MKRNYIICLLTLLFNIHAYAASGYWQCPSQDSANQSWVAEHQYQKSALNKALGLCKKESKDPASCKVSMDFCTGVNQTKSTVPTAPTTKPLWQCSALDFNATSWNSNFYSTRDKAALGSLIFCKAKSSVPETCYINTLTCYNKLL